MNFNDASMIGKKAHDLAHQLWPINRSLTGEGVRKTLEVLKIENLNLKTYSAATGVKVFDWEVPKEWNVKEAYLICPDGEKICEFTKNNLHLVGYSTPINIKMPLAELQKNLYSLPEQPDAIPYITSYYKNRWGFCLTHNQRETLKEGDYQVYIDSSLEEGVLNYAEIYTPGQSKKEVFLSTYICHPSMANNELSGVVIATYLSKWLNQRKNYYSYRIVFVPETIGSITYLSKNLDVLKNNVIAGFNISCVGDDRCYSYLPSRDGETLSDRVAKHVLKHTDANYITYNWNDRGSDERQYCAPGIDLPVASMMRSKYGEYPEYHTSLDDLINVVTPQGLAGGYAMLKRAIELIENNCYPKITVLGEPQLGKRGLYPTLSTKESNNSTRTMMNFITWSDGHRDLLEIADKCGCPAWELLPIMEQLKNTELLEVNRG